MRFGKAQARHSQNCSCISYICSRTVVCRVSTASSSLRRSAKCSRVFPDNMEQHVPPQGRITCPHCGHVSVETMPINACLYFFECSGCSTLLRPNAGDCCVFCSFGDALCPPRAGQLATCC